MKKMNLNQMENVQAGSPPRHVECGLSIASALIIGTGGIITAAYRWYRRSSLRYWR